MKKIKIVGSGFTSTQKPVAEYVLRLEAIGGALLARYFRVLGEREAEYEVIDQTLAPFDPASTPLLRQVVTERNFVAAKAVTSNAALAERVLSEIGRHVFRPTIGPETICGSGERHDFAAFVLPFGSDGAVAEPYNHFTESESVKGPIPRNGRLRAAQPILVLYTDVSGSPLADWTIAYVDSPPFVLEDLTGGDWTPAPSGFGVYSFLPEFVLTAPATIERDGYATVSVALRRGGSAIPYSGEIVVEAVSGYAPKRRVSVVGGVGSFKVGALGLDVGDEVRVKVGTRTISGLASASIRVA